MSKARENKVRKFEKCFKAVSFKETYIKLDKKWNPILDSSWKFILVDKLINKK